MNLAKILRGNLTCFAALLLALVGLVPMEYAWWVPENPVDWSAAELGYLLAGSGVFLIVFCLFTPRGGMIRASVAIIGTFIGSAAILSVVKAGTANEQSFAFSVWVYAVAMGLFIWHAMTVISARPNLPRAIGLLVPALFGIGIFYVWEILVNGFQIPTILLPSPSEIWPVIDSYKATLWRDFRQTYLKAVIGGFAIGCGGGMAIALIVDRMPFMQRGLLPLGSMVSALPIIGVAPILVMWFGPDWQSKAAVVVVMTFFPMLVNAHAGLAATSAMELDLMRSYGAGYWRTLLKVRLPNALPFIFNALKINSTLALIGAIVAEFFGSPTSGMGFRISMEVGRLHIPQVWATIAVAALAGSISYGLLALLERASTFWHPSYRRP